MCAKATCIMISIKLPTQTDANRVLHFSINLVYMFTQCKEILTKKLSESYSFFLIVHRWTHYVLHTGIYLRTSGRRGVLKTQTSYPKLRALGVSKAQTLENLRADLHGTTLSHATSLRQAYDMNCFV